MALLILPDIHGRPFWKKAVEENFDKVDKVIFLGDYHDPYPWEYITKKESIANFREIIDLKEKNKDKVILLLGNHCLHYVDKSNFYTRPRYDSTNAQHLEELFRNKISLFQLAHEETVNNKHILFTHSGLLPQWYELHKDFIGDLTVENLNKLLNTPEGMRILCEVSPLRGGWDRCSSFVWGDVRDMPDRGLNDKLPWSFQIFGHTQLQKHPIITEDFACIDCRKAFILNDEGHFNEIE